MSGLGVDSPRGSSRVSAAVCGEDADVLRCTLLYVLSATVPSCSISWNGQGETFLRSSGEYRATTLHSVSHRP